MYKRNRVKKLGRTKSHRDSLIRNQIRSLLTKGSIKTTSAKAKVLRSKVSKFLFRMESLNNGDNKVIYNREVEAVTGKGTLKDNVAKVLANGNLGVSIVKIGFRDGDNAEVSKVTLLGLVDSKKKIATKVADKDITKAKKKAKKKTSDSNSKGIESKGKKDSASKKNFTRTKERAHSRSGL